MHASWLQATCIHLFTGMGAGSGQAEMRAHKPKLAAIVDDELARLEAEKAARGTKRNGAR